MSAAATRVAVVGCGVFGRNHARVYRQLQHEGVGIEFVGVVDTDSQRARSLAAEFGTQSIASIGDLRGKIDAASVAVLTSLHLIVGRDLLELGADWLVDMPM